MEGYFVKGYDKQSLSASNGEHHGPPLFLTMFTQTLNENHWHHNGMIPCGLIYIYICRLWSSWCHHEKILLHLWISQWADEEDYYQPSEEAIDKTLLLCETSNCLSDMKPKVLLHSVHTTSLVNNFPFVYSN